MPQIPTIPEDSDLSPEVSGGFEDFIKNIPFRPDAEPSWQRGWNLAWTRCYGQGVKASIQHASIDKDEELDNPYPQFSNAWEAWASGTDEQEHL